ncbi:MAG: EamA family transporter [Ignavibacteriaceae bacterium]|jgi:drug/metabolite transporter (DMT)-like permease|nr:EamA family transporter [Ignavibacteriaceae bacterium]MCW8812647.1 EamA family transporter [Chlorobium sp.]MCW8817503.1 EamA family transporter [Ignavibacteriaceae bacterium]MCW9094719.1 EamA family transporter [Ignavibacteriaceae bacterium]MCW9097025.1 EamA family transporter [Ignavibacteriaceae bacterium]
MKEKYSFRAYLAWITICMVWGTTYLAIRIGVAELPPMLFAGFRWLVAGLLMTILLNLRGYTLPRLNELKHLAIVGILLIGVANGLVVVAEQWLPSGLTALILSSLPFWVVGLESLLPKGPKINWLILTGLFLGTAGVILIFAKDLNVTVEFNTLLGAVCLLGGVVSWSVGSLYWKYKPTNVRPLMGAAVQMLIAGILQTLLGFILGEQNSFILTQNGFLALGYLILFGSILGYASYIYSITNLPLSLVSTYAYVNPIIALILGWYFLNEPLTMTVFIAAGLILIGVAVVKRGSTLAVRKLNVTTTQSS